VSLGPVTERRFEEAFRDSALVTAKAAASLIGLDEKTLKTMTMDGAIQACPRGRRHAYSERALRDYLTNPPPVPSSNKDLGQGQFASGRKAGSGTTTSRTRPVTFTAIQMAKKAEKLERENKSCAMTERSDCSTTVAARPSKRDRS